MKKNLRPRILVAILVASVPLSMIYGVRQPTSILGYLLIAPICLLFIAALLAMFTAAAEYAILGTNRVPDTIVYWLFPKLKPHDE